MPANPTRSQTELVENSQKVLRKIWMFAQTSRLINRLPHTSEGLDLDEQIQGLALLESMLIHARELMLFLYAPPKGKYIRAVDFLGDRSSLPDKWTSYPRDLELIDKDLAHLTREDVGDKIEWKVRNELTSALRAFVNTVPKELVVENFKALARGPLDDQTDRARLMVSNRDGSKTVRAHRIHELFEDG